MKTTIFDAITAAYQNITWSVKAANACEQAYAELTGGTFTPFTEAEPQKVAMNLAGVYAADNAAQILAMQSNWFGGTAIKPKAYERVLEKIAAGRLSPVEMQVVRLMANATWRAGQPFRGLERLTRDINVAFPLLKDLDAVELQKDTVQIRTGAILLLEVIATYHNN